MRPWTLRVRRIPPPRFHLERISSIILLSAGLSRSQSRAETYGQAHRILSAIPSRNSSAVTVFRSRNVYRIAPSRRRLLQAEQAVRRPYYRDPAKSTAPARQLRLLGYEPTDELRYAGNDVHVFMTAGITEQGGPNGPGVDRATGSLHGPSASSFLPNRTGEAVSDRGAGDPRTDPFLSRIVGRGTGGTRWWAGSAPPREDRPERGVSRGRAKAGLGRARSKRLRARPSLRSGA